MATPKPQSYEQFLGDMLRAYQSKTGINDLNTGSNVTSFYETIALALARASGDVFQLLRDLSVDRATGDALRKIAKDEGLQELPARVASGEVTIIDTSFEKISSKIYAGANPPNIGSTTILVSDATDFTATGSIYIGRGSPNVEGPIAYSAKTPIGGYWSLTLSSPTTKFHNINESVILAQGGVRNVPIGTVVRAPASGASPDINFSTTQTAVILDGENQVSGVPVSAQEPGTAGNVPIGAIREFAAEPFSGASVSNSLPYKTGRDVETDDELRIRIKRARLSRGLGTALAVKNSVIGATPSDENATVVSSEIVTGSDGLTTLFVDDGSGYESKTDGVGIEVLVDSAIGGEDHFQLKTGGRQTSVAKAFLVSNLKGPFDVAGTDRLAISIGGETTEHIFSDDDFISPGGATAYELVASINANTALNFNAATVEGGTKVILFGKAEFNEAIKIEEVTTGRDVAELIGLPSNQVETLRLFLNKQPLHKDGIKATVRSERQADWSASITTGDTLILEIDGTASIIYTITDADFIAEGTYTSVSFGNSLESWVNVLNNKLTGVTATVVGERITITSNLDESDRAAVSIDPSSTLVVKGMFGTTEGLSASGQAADYELSRNTAQIRLATPLSPGDNLTAGTEDTEARLESDRILGGTITLSADGYFWLLVDDSEAEIINTGVVSNTVLSVAKPSANIVRFSSTTPNAFGNVQEGDYVIVWSEELSAANRIEGRVNAVSALNLDIKVTAAEYAAAVVEGPLVFQEGLIVIRTDKVPQKFKVASGTKTLNEVADELNAEATNCEFSVFDDEILVLKTNTKTSTGAMLVITSDANAKPLSLPEGESSTSNESLFAFYESGYREGGFPLFVHSDFATEDYAVPPDSYISAITTGISLSGAGLDPNFLVGYLQPYGSVLDALSPSENTPLDSYSGSSITIEADNLVKRLRIADRWYAANPLDFGHEEDMIVVLDGDASNKTFAIPFYRKVLTNTTLAVNPTSFNAYDYDAGPTAPFTTYFDSTFLFDNYKVLMRAKNVIDPPNSEDALLFRAVQWGRSGEKVNVGYIYPTAANSDITSVVTVDKDVNIRIALKSGAVVPTTIDGTTEWDVTITPSTPSAGTDQVTYTWTGTGTAPGLGGLAGGEYVNIISGSLLNEANLGTFRVSTEVGFTPTATSFTVVRENGAAVAEADIATLVAGVFTFYAASSTTAADVETYVNDTLYSFIEATIVDDGGTSGSGVIEKSTFEENDFSYESVYLLDGLNWIASTDLSSSPQFVLKQSLSLPSATGYAFNDGEEVRFVPTNLEQLILFLNVLAVTGYATLGRIKATRRDGRLELSTKTLGGDGSVQVVGGQANASETPILGSSYTFDNQYTISSINKSGIDGLHSDQWVKLEATNKQKKDSLFKSSMNIRIEPDLPTAGQSTVTLYNRTLTDRHFGKPRHHVRTRDRNIKVERQGDLTCFSWDTTGTQPFFQKTVNLDDSLGGTLNVEKITGTSETRYIVLTGNANFSEVSIGDLVVIQNMADEANNGTFLVTGVNEDGTVLRVLNASGVSRFSSGSFTITDNTDIAGDDFIVDGNTLTAGVDFTVGGTADISAQNLASAISALPGVSATSSSNVVTIVADNPSASISMSYVNNIGLAGATASGAFLVGDSFSSGDFACTTEIGENDTIIIGSPFNVLNQGKFRVIRRYNNSFYIENENSIEELVTMAYDSVSLGFDGTTEFDIDASDNKIKLSWNGNGTEPDLGEAKVGDELTLGTDFNSDNQGSWMITKAESKLKEITRLTMPQGSLINGGEHFYLNAANDATLYYVWYKVNGVGVDPAPGGRTGILVNISNTDTAAEVADATAAAIDAIIDFESASEDAYVRVTNADFGPCTDASNIDVSGGLVIEIVQQGQRTFLEAINAKAANDTAITVSDVLECHRPPFLIYEYEASVADDMFKVTSDFLDSGNLGSWKILEVLDQDKVVVDGTMVGTDPVSVAGSQDSLMIEERIPFSGYKKLRMLTVDPANILQRGLAVFDSRHQANRINEAAGTQISAVGKLGFSEILRKGLDSYRFDIGLIGEANRIVYGEPRDSTTYPGVAAAGAEIFIRPPLIRRVEVGIAVRLETGIPFAQIVEQVRTNVSALINGNAIGVPIAISDIVSVVNSIPGVRAMAVTSPLYNASNDTINIGPSEKAKVIDPVNDISTTQIT
jgi:uncharacterized phage protein gp47/JayE